MMAEDDYDPQRRTRREHRRVVLPGSERFEADRFALEGQNDAEPALHEHDVTAVFGDEVNGDGFDDGDENMTILDDDSVGHDGVDDAPLLDSDHVRMGWDHDDERILAELPPHWAQFTERD